MEGYFKLFIILSLNKLNEGLTRFSPLFYFYTPWFSDIFRGYRNETLGLNIVRVVAELLSGWHKKSEVG